MDEHWREKHANRLQRFAGRVYLFIYKVRHRYDEYEWADETRFCTVFTVADRFEDAEQIAINCVHQHGWRILKADTATAFDVSKFGDGALDSGHLANLVEFGSSFHLESGS